MNNQHKISRGLTLQNQHPSIDQIPQKYKTLTIDNANIGQINSTNIRANSVRTNSADIGQINIGYNTETDTSYLQIPNNFMVRTNENNGIIFSNNGEISAENFNVNNIFSALDGNFSGDIEANNLSLLGDLFSTNGHITNQLNVDNGINSRTINTENLNTNNIFALDGHYKNGLSVGNLCVAGITETQQISSISDLIISVGPNRTIIVPNIRYNVDLSNNRVIGPPEVKLSKTFIATGDIILTGDPDCDGLEIYIYNNSIVTIKINGPHLITTIPQKMAKKFVYLAFILKWINI